MTNPATPQAPPAAPAPRTAHRAGRITPLLLLTGILFSLAASAATAGSAPAAARAVRQAPEPELELPWADTFRQPREIRPVNHVLDVTLRVVQTRLPVPIDGTNQLPLRAYRVVSVNGRTPADTSATYPGPTFRVERGDLVRIKLVNGLTNPDTVCMVYPASQSGEDTYPDCFHGPDWTNIHYHGSHVPPDGTGDNVLLEIAPGDSFQYSFRIPQNQSPGTHWYHPHKHGSVALQVANAMSGALIVEGGALDSLTRANNIREYLLAVQQIDSQVNLVDGSFGATTVVNGLVSPEIPMNPGEVVRLRIVNENTSHTASFSLFFPAGTKVIDIARDGVQFDPANYDTLVLDDSLYMAPGNRLDVFVRAPGTPGTYELRARQPNQGRQSRRLLRQGGQVVQPGRAPQQATTPLARIRVARTRATGYSTTLPAELPPLPPFLADIGPTRDTAVVVFIDAGSQSKSHQTPTQFFLGNAQNRLQKYNPNQVYVPTSAGGDSLPMVLGDSQTWKVMNYGIAFNHPFHIHINPFQVLQVVHPNPTDGFGAYYDSLNAAAARGAPIWMDVVPLPLPRFDTTGATVDTVPGYVILRQRYEDFTGEFVMHCHVLGHEERGMMQLLEVVAPGTTPVADQRRMVGHPVQRPPMPGLLPPPGPPAPPPAPERQRVPVQKDPPRTP